jgi:hypothetical protein
METNRASRRRATAKVKAKRSKSYWGRLNQREEPMTPRQSGIVTNTAAPCSCAMCGNVRRITGQRTLKEIIQLIDLKEAHHALGN